MMANETIANRADLDAMLDQLAAGKPGFWNRFYADRSKNVPFFANVPDENLVSYVDNRLVRPGKALDIGCGAGRNAIYLARVGFDVDAVDNAEEAIRWAKERGDEADASVRFVCGNALELTARETYDFVYDSGCMHHLLPHRRIQYLDFVVGALKPGGFFGLTCFATGHGGEGGPVRDMTDWDVYREGTMNGGLAFTERKLQQLFSGRLRNVQMRKMKPLPAESGLFGVSFLWTSLWMKE